MKNGLLREVEPVKDRVAGAGVPSVLVLICGGGRTVMADHRAVVDGVGESGGMAVTW